MMQSLPLFNRSNIKKAIYIARSEGVISLLKKVRYTLNLHSQIANNNYVLDESNFESCRFKSNLSEVLFEVAIDGKSQYHKKFREKPKVNFEVDVIAFYLPQFHPFTENNKWWGKGFTEWSNVSKATPQFQDHYQPKLPSDLGFYDLRLTSEIMKEQATIAKNYGVKGFCFHHYWFDGHRLMETPVDNFIKDSTIDIDFCLCWANENWTRRWDGAENDILIAQNHSAEDDIAFIADVSRYMADSRYIRVHGKPILIVYRVALLPDPEGTVKRWRKYCAENGIGDIHLICAQSFGITDPEAYGFDAAVEFPPHGLNISAKNSEHLFYNRDFSGIVYHYSDVVDSSDNYIKPSYEVYRSVFPSWDNEARKPGKGHIFYGSTPELYGRWLRNACEYSMGNNKERLVFINAWNEWAEGAYLEPDRRYGYAYLDTTYNVLSSLSSPRSVSVLMPVYNHEKYVYEAISSIANQTLANIELVIVDDGSADLSVAEIERAIADFSHLIDIKFIKSINRGSVDAIHCAFINSQHDIISIINSDDLYHLDRLEKCVDVILANDTDLVFTDVKFINDKSHDLMPELGNQYDLAIEKLKSTSDLFESCKYFNLMFSTGNIVMKRTLYSELSGFSDFKLCHDWDFLLRALNCSNVYYLKDKLYFYRYHDSNTFSSLGELAISETKAILGQFK